MQQYAIDKMGKACGKLAIHFCLCYWCRNKSGL